MNTTLRNLAILLACITPVIFWLTIVAKEEDTTTKPVTLPPAPAAKQVTGPRQLTNVIQETDRQVLFNTWMASAERVADESGTAEAHEVLNFIKQHSHLSMPDRTGEILSVIEPERAALIDFEHDPWFGVYMMCRGDDRLNMNLYTQYHGASETGHASFSPESRLLILKAHVPMSWISQGILALHEGKHAKEWLTRRYNVSDSTVWCDEERKVYNFQNELFRSVFGKTYDEKLEHLAQEFADISRATGKQPGEHLVSMDRWYSEFDEVLPPVESEYEQLFRNSHLWIHGCFRMLELAHPRTSEQEKVRLLLWVRQFGSIPNTLHEKG